MTFTHAMLSLSLMVSGATNLYQIKNSSLIQFRPLTDRRRRHSSASQTPKRPRGRRDHKGKLVEVLRFVRPSSTVRPRSVSSKTFALLLV